MGVAVGIFAALCIVGGVGLLIGVFVWFCVEYAKGRRDKPRGFDVLPPS